MATNEPTLNVLISSKQKEFVRERADIRSLMAPMPLLVADAAEDWDPQSAAIRETYLRQAKSCALYVGLFGCVFSAPTIEEYRAAAGNPLRQVLVYVKECAGGRDAALTDFLHELSDPESGRTLVTYTVWDEVRPQFMRHLWAAIQRMIEHCIELGNKPVTLSSGAGALERRRHRYEAALAEMGFPVEGDRALELAAELRRFTPPD